MRLCLLAALASLATLTLTGSAAAEQFVLVDADYAHSAGSHAYHPPTGKQPANWKTPVNYAEGTAYYRLEVFEKASDENLHMGICFVGGSYCCFGYEQFTKPGVYEWSFAIPMMWQYDTMDWSKNMTDVPLIMRDRNAVKVDDTEAYYGKPNTALYFPMKSHLTVTIVSKGATYVKPSDAGAADGATDSASMDSAAIDSATMDSAAIDSAVAEDSATSPDDAGSDAGPSDDAAGGASDVASSSSSCTAGASSRATYRAPGASFLFIAALLRARRRRPSGNVERRS